MTTNRFITTVFAVAFIVAFAGDLYWWCEASNYRDALEISRRTVAERNNEIDELNRVIEAWVKEHPPGDDVEPKMGANGRILPQVRDLTREANEAVIESRQILRKVDRLITDVESGAVGLKITGSVLRGEARVEAERK